jgi:dephospho-CoA kinase
VGKAFPQARKGKRIDRKILGSIVFNNPAARKKLEKILHPLVRKDSDKFLKLCRQKGRKLAVLDVPLLFETKQEKRFDHIICVTAPQFLQKQRVLSRPNMTESRLRAILKLQMPDAEKRRRADTVINTSLGYRATLVSVKKLLKRLRNKEREE